MRLVKNQEGIGSMKCGFQLKKEENSQDDGERKSQKSSKGSRPFGVSPRFPERDFQEDDMTMCLSC